VKNVVLLGLLMVLFDSYYVECSKDDSDSSIGFLDRTGNNFIVNGKHFYFNGFNAYWLMVLASDPSTTCRVTSALQQARNYGLTVVRT